MKKGLSILLLLGTVFLGGGISAENKTATNLGEAELKKWFFRVFHG